MTPRRTGAAVGDDVADAVEADGLGVGVGCTVALCVGDVDAVLAVDDVEDGLADPVGVGLAVAVQIDP